MRPLIFFLILITALAGASSSVAQDTEPTPVASPVVDSSRALDTTVVDTADVSDSLSPGERARQFFERRVQQMQQQASLDTIPPKLFSVRDSLRTWFLPERWNLRPLIDRSYVDSPADYLKFEPSILTFDYLGAPYRATGQPFAVPGDRLGVVFNGRTMKPFEHSPEPDALTDLYDLPTVLDDAVYVVPGPIGRLFGADGLATLVSRPVELQSTDPRSSLYVDKVVPGASSTRGRFNKRFRDNRLIRIGIAYHASDRAGADITEDSYTYDAIAEWPLSKKVALHVAGYVFDREGEYYVRPLRDGSTVARDRFDRSLATSVVYRRDSISPVYELGYEHRRNGSYTNGRYRSRNNFTAHSAIFRRSWPTTFGVAEGFLTVDYDEYDSGPENHGRMTGETGLSAARSSGASRYTLYLSGRYFDKSLYVGSLSAAWLRETERSLVSSSIGFTTRHPSLLQTFLPSKELSSFGGLAFYAEQGNERLTAEEELFGNVTLSLGPSNRATSLSLNGGKLSDGIRWQADFDTAVIQLGAFSPINQDMDFISASLTQHWPVRDWLSWYGGGAYYHLSEDLPYTPDHRAFSGLELHFNWKPKLIHLYGYLESSWVGSYRGYLGQDLGQDFILDARFSLQMGRFRMYYLLQNLISTEYEVREDIRFLGRYVSWGFVWHFID